MTYITSITKNESEFDVEVEIEHDIPDPSVGYRGGYHVRSVKCTECSSELSITKEEKELLATKYKESLYDRKKRAREEKEANE